ncbi:hypothetical protein EWB00_005261 [Schistosoma japonicum]|uniref:Uncharacterized protein n=1 Tax=Schistosoma japonicum TaxID=6182 RepID=A0A4Z2D230_SCHJA|nr:hypothetical protein EWB00_005261 [Schistosoma japonicum]
MMEVYHNHVHLTVNSTHETLQMPSGLQSVRQQLDTLTTSLVPTSDYHFQYKYSSATIHTSKEKMKARNIIDPNTKLASIESIFISHIYGIQPLMLTNSLFTSIVNHYTSITNPIFVNSLHCITSFTRLSREATQCVYALDAVIRIN